MYLLSEVDEGGESEDGHGHQDEEQAELLIDFDEYKLIEKCGQWSPCKPAARCRTDFASLQNV